MLELNPADNSDTSKRQYARRNRELEQRLTRAQARRDEQQFVLAHLATHGLPADLSDQDLRAYVESLVAARRSGETVIVPQPRQPPVQKAAAVEIDTGSPEKPTALPTGPPPDEAERPSGNSISLLLSCSPNGSYLGRHSPGSGCEGINGNNHAPNNHCPSSAILRPDDPDRHPVLVPTSEAVDGRYTGTGGILLQLGHPRSELATTLLTPTKSTLKKH